MKRALILSILTVTVLGLRPTPAYADLTAFLGVSPTPATRQTKGVAIGLSLLIVGFEFEYGKTSENVEKGAPSLTTGMFNGLVMTPTRNQIYLTAGGGVYHEKLAADTSTSVGTNFGGGVKLHLAGPVRLRLDYRVFALIGHAKYKAPQRFYAGFNMTF